MTKRVRLLVAALAACCLVVLAGCGSGGNSEAKEKQADPTLMTEEEFFAKIERAEEQFRRGEGIRFTDRDEMNAWLNSL